MNQACNRIILRCVRILLRLSALSLLAAEKLSRLHGRRLRAGKTLVEPKPALFASLTSFLR